MTTEKRVTLPGFCSNFTIFGYLYCAPLRQGRFPLSILLLEIYENARVLSSFYEYVRDIQVVHEVWLISSHWYFCCWHAPPFIAFPQIFVRSLIIFPNWKTFISDMVIRLPLCNKSSSIKFKMTFVTMKSYLLFCLSENSPRVGPQAISSITFVQSTSIRVVFFRAFQLLLMKNRMRKKPFTLKLLVSLPFRTDKTLITAG